MYSASVCLELEIGVKWTKLEPSRSLWSTAPKTQASAAFHEESLAFKLKEKCSIFPQETAVAEISKLGAKTDVKGAWRFPKRRQLSVCPSVRRGPKTQNRHLDGQTDKWINKEDIQALQHLNHVNFLIKSNSMAYKLVDPSRGMCSLWIEKIWGSPRHLTLSIPFKVVFYFHSLSQTLTSWTILATYIIKLHSYPFYY